MLLAGVLAVVAQWAVADGEKRGATDDDREQQTEQKEGQPDAKKPAVTLSATIETDAKEDDAKSSQSEKTAEGSYTGEVTIDDVVIEYHAKVSAIEVSRNEGDVKAKVYYTEYVRSDVKQNAKRPVTFCFNGGPGSASLWLHLGGISPRRISFTPNELNPKSWSLKPNESSILDQTDLVFIDPVSTGYSRPNEEKQNKEFTGFDNDVASVAEFIRLWTATNGRWSSPQYLLGESYGGIRGVAVAGYLMREYRYSVEGLIMVSPVIDFQTIRFSESNELPYVLFLPSYTATAYHHGKIDQQKYPTMKAAVDAAEAFALGDYASALLRGDAQRGKRRQRVIAKLSELTGLSPEYIKRANLRVSMSRFGKELLRDEREIIGRFDGRYKSPDWDGTADNTEFDPSGSFIMASFSEAMQQYYYDEFGLRETRPYLALSGKVHPWNYDRFEGEYANAADTLRETMTQNPNMRVLFTLGYTDLATPFLGSLHTIRHLGIDPSLRKNITTRFYDAGHMMYLRDSEQRQLKHDLDAFYQFSQPR